MGVVWLARDERLGDTVALKLLPPEIQSDPVALDDLRRETLKSRRLTHPNSSSRIHDFFEAPGEAAFISMEFVDGPNLTELRLQQPARLFTWEFFRPLARQLCDAMEYAHTEKVIHRDLKPGNMMLDSRGRLKLADFGIAATVSDSVSRVSLRQMTSGTPTFMSPQQMEGQMPRVADDIYALGATLYELLTSRPPFHTGDIHASGEECGAHGPAERLADLEFARNEIPADVARHGHGVPGQGSGAAAAQRPGGRRVDWPERRDRGTGIQLGRNRAQSPARKRMQASGRADQRRNSRFASIREVAFSVAMVVLLIGACGAVFYAKKTASRAIRGGVGCSSCGWSGHREGYIQAGASSAATHPP